MKKLNTILLILLTFLADSASAHPPKVGTIMATMGPYIYRTSFDSRVNGVDSPIMAGAGLIVEGDVDKNGGLEIGAFYLHKDYFRRQDGGVLQQTNKIMYITMGYRHWLTHRFSGAAALYSSYTMGDFRTVHTDFPSGSDVDTSAHDTTDYGFDFSLQYEFLTIDRLHFVFDARYSLNVTPKYHEEADHYGALVGVKYMVQEKYPTRSKATPPERPPELK